MNTLSSQFNAYAQWEASLWPLYILVLIDEPERRKERQRRRRLSKLQRGFQEASEKQSREQYQRQVQARHPQPQYRVTSPGF